MENKLLIRKTTNYLYSVYHGMKHRCYNPNSPDYVRYGGRGIRICERWLGKDGFDYFVRDMGERDSANHSIDRIANDGNYEPDNCRWATKEEQDLNRRPQPNTKLTSDVVNSIREEYAAGGVTHRQLGSKYGVHHSNIGYIVKHKRWRR